MEVWQLNNKNKRHFSSTLWILHLDWHQIYIHSMAGGEGMRPCKIVHAEYKIIIYTCTPIASTVLPTWPTYTTYTSTWQCITAVIQKRPPPRLARCAAYIKYTSCALCALCIHCILYIHIDIYKLYGVRPICGTNTQCEPCYVDMLYTVILKVTPPNWQTKHYLNRRLGFIQGGFVPTQYINIFFPRDVVLRAVQGRGYYPGNIPGGYCHVMSCIVLSCTLGGCRGRGIIYTGSRGSPAPSSPPPRPYCTKLSIFPGCIIGLSNNISSKIPFKEK